MNINYIKSVLVNMLSSSEEFYEIRTKELIQEITSYQDKESEMESIEKILSTANGYVTTYLTLLDEYNAIPNTSLSKKIFKAGEIVCVLSAVHTYLFSTLTKYTCDESKDPTLYKYLRTLEEKKTYYKSEKYSWTKIVEALSQESNRITSLAKLRVYENRTT